MFNLFNDKARRPIALALKEAMILKHDSIGAEHIFLGLLHAGIAPYVLAASGLKPREVRREIEGQMGRGHTAMYSGQLPFTPGAKATLERTLDEARALGHAYVGAEHLLLAMLCEESPNPVRETVEKLGGKVRDLRQRVLEILADEKAHSIAKRFRGSRPLHRTPGAEPSWKGSLGAIGGLLGFCAVFPMLLLSPGDDTLVRLVLALLPATAAALLLGWLGRCVGRRFDRRPRVSK